jgi:hypothetical protein
VLGCFLRFFVALARRSRAAAHLVGADAELRDPVDADADFGERAA